MDRMHKTFTLFTLIAVAMASFALTGCGEDQVTGVETSDLPAETEETTDETAEGIAGLESGAAGDGDSKFFHTR